MSKIRVWVEVLTTERFSELMCDTPDGWESMDAAARQAYMQGVFDAERDNACNGGFEEVADDAVEGQS